MKHIQFYISFLITFAFIVGTAEYMTFTNTAMPQQIAESNYGTSCYSCNNIYNSEVKGVVFPGVASPAEAMIDPPRIPPPILAPVHKDGPIAHQNQGSLYVRGQPIRNVARFFHNRRPIRSFFQDRRPIRRFFGRIFCGRGCRF